MKFDTPAGITPIDQLKVVGKPVDRIEGPLKVTGTAPYAYEWHDNVQELAYGYIVGAAIAKGRIAHIDTTDAANAAGVLHVLTYKNAQALGTGEFYVQRFLAAPEVEHYHQPVAVVVADTFEQARAAAALVRVEYVREAGRYDLAQQLDSAPIAQQAPFGGPPQTSVGDFAAAFAAAPVKVDASYTTPDQAHAMMEPHASIASWQGDQLTCRTLDPANELGPARSGQDPRHSQAAHPLALAVYRRRLRGQGYGPVGSGHGRTRCQSGR